MECINFIKINFIQQTGRIVEEGKSLNKKKKPRLTGRAMERIDDLHNKRIYET
jgi:hypothetical protein